MIRAGCKMSGGSVKKIVILVISKRLQLRFFSMYPLLMENCDRIIYPKENHPNDFLDYSSEQEYF